MFFFFFDFFLVFLVFLTTFGPHHFWPTPLLAQTAFAPDRFFDQTVLCPNLCEPSLTPKKPWPMGLLFGTICCSCLVCWAMDRGTSGICCCCCVVLGCVVGVVCRCGVCSRLGASKIWALRLTLRRTSPDSPFSWTPLSGPPKISLFCSLSRHNFHSFFLSWEVVSWDFGGVIEGRDHQMCIFGSRAVFAAACACFCCLYNCCCFFSAFADAFGPPLPPLQCLTFQNVNNFFLKLIGTLWTSTNCNKICWHPTEFPREDALTPHPSGPNTSWPYFFCFGSPHSGLLAAVVV